MRLPCAASGLQLDTPIEEVDHTYPGGVGRLPEEEASDRDPESLAFVDGSRPYLTKPAVDRQTEEDTDMTEVLRDPAQQTEDTMKEGTWLDVSGTLLPSRGGDVRLKDEQGREREGNAKGKKRNGRWVNGMGSGKGERDQRQNSKIKKRSE
jgi:hypothetical protein